MKAKYIFLIYSQGGTLRNFIFADDQDQVIKLIALFYKEGQYYMQKTEVKATLGNPKHHINHIVTVEDNSDANELHLLLQGDKHGQVLKATIELQDGEVSNEQGNVIKLDISNWNSFKYHNICDDCTDGWWATEDSVGYKCLSCNGTGKKNENF